MRTQRANGLMGSTAATERYGDAGQQQHFQGQAAALPGACSMSYQARGECHLDPAQRAGLVVCGDRERFLCDLEAGCKWHLCHLPASTVGLEM
jgi:hypothetical protein